MSRLYYNRHPKCVEIILALEFRAYYCWAYYGTPFMFLRADHFASQNFMILAKIQIMLNLPRHCDNKLLVGSEATSPKKVFLSTMRFINLHSQYS